MAIAIIIIATATMSYLLRIKKQDELRRTSKTTVNSFPS
jgi:hypothetical protein